MLRVGAQASHAGPLFRDKADGPKLAEILTGALRGTGGGGVYCVVLVMNFSALKRSLREFNLIVAIVG